MHHIHKGKYISHKKHLDILLFFIPPLSQFHDQEIVNVGRIAMGKISMGQVKPAVSTLNRLAHRTETVLAVYLINRPGQCLLPLAVDRIEKVKLHRTLRSDFIKHDTGFLEKELTVVPVRT